MLATIFDYEALLQQVCFNNIRLGGTAFVPIQKIKDLEVLAQKKYTKGTRADRIRSRWVAAAQTVVYLFKGATQTGHRVCDHARGVRTPALSVGDPENCE